MDSEMIILPKDLLETEQFKVMPALEKDSYLDKTLKKILDLNSNGITAPVIARALGVNASTIWRHLEKLTSTREGYKISYGKTTVYYPNGKMIHHFKKEDLILRDKAYSFFYVVNNFGKFMYLQEKKQDRLGASEVVGGLLIPVNKIGEFVNAIIESSKEIIKLDKIK
jgi:biotin operon repressor